MSEAHFSCTRFPLHGQRAFTHLRLNAQIDCLGHEYRLDNVAFERIHVGHSRYTFDQLYHVAGACQEYEVQYSKNVKSRVYLDYGNK